MKTHPNIPPDADLDLDAVALRQRAMVEAGAHPMIADRLARDASRAQSLRNARLKLAATTIQEPALVTEPAVVTQAVAVPAVEPAAASPGV